MTHKIKSVKVLDGMQLSVGFQNGIEKIYDLHMLYPMFPQFKELEKCLELFSSVKVDVGGYGVVWDDELDLDAEEIWENGKQISVQPITVMDMLADSLVQARAKAGMTQKQLAEVTGIHQADISKIERGLANPSLSTLQRLAEGLEASLVVQIK